jgi:hypothetical protein
MMLAALVQSVGGFGFALLAVPLAAIVIDLTTAVIAVSIASVFNVAALVLRVYKDIDRATAARFNVPALLGMPFGLVILAMVNQELLKIVLGALIVVATVALMRGAGNLRHHHWVDVLAGWLSGILATSTGTNGPPLVLAAQMAKLSPAAFRATLTFTFLCVRPDQLGVFWLRRILQSSGAAAGWWLDPTHHHRAILRFALTQARRRPTIRTAGVSTAAVERFVGRNLGCAQLANHPSHASLVLGLKMAFDERTCDIAACAAAEY